MDDSVMRERYNQIRVTWPALFVNPPDASFRIVFDNEQIQRAQRDEEALLASKGMPRQWSRTGVVYEDPYIIVVRDAIQRPDESFGTYVRTLPASGAAGVVILPVMNDKIVLLRHFRHATREVHLEVPRGFGEPGVSAFRQAKNELYEETGARVEDQDLIELGRFHSNNGIASDCVDLFYAKIESIGEFATEEGISGFKVCPVGEVARLIRTGEISDSFTIGAFTRAWLKGILPGWPPPAGGRSSFEER